MVSHLVWQCRFSSFTLSLLWCYCVALSYVCGVVLFVYDTWRNAEHIAVLLVLYIKLLTHQTFPVTVHISLACVSLCWAHTGSLALLEGSVCVKYHKHCHIFRGHSNTGTAKRCKVFFLTVNTAAVSSGDCWQNHFYKSIIDCNRPEQKEEKKVQIFSSLELMFWLLCAANQRDWLQRACFYRYRATKRSSCCCPAYMSQSFMFSAPDENTQVFQAI